MDNKAFPTPCFAAYAQQLISDEVTGWIGAYADLARRVRGITFHDPNLMTCFANDFGYDHWVAKAVEHCADPGDAVVLISTSGESTSVVNAAHMARDMGLKVVTFTGHLADITPKSLGDVNFWVLSHAYNLVENLHAIWLTATIDLIIGKDEHETRAIE